MAGRAFNNVSNLPCRKRDRSGSLVRSQNPNLSMELKPFEKTSNAVAQKNASDVLGDVSNDRLTVNPLVVASKKLKFACQLAHGSPVAIIEKWSTIEELYESIACAFGIKKEDIMFLTVNDFNIDMRNLFCGTLNFNDMLFAHVKGQNVELRILKDSNNFGVTITDNGMGNAFIKIIAKDSVFARAAPATAVGQIIESVNGIRLIGKRHYEVARVLKSIKKGETCTIRLISPIKSGNVSVLNNDKNLAASKIKGTIRFKSDGGYAVEDIQDQIIQAEMCGKLNELFDSYLGVQDDQLAMRIWETSSKCETLMELTNAIKESELSMFEFPDALIFDMWGIIGDLKRERKAAVAAVVPTVVPSRQSAMTLFPSS